MKIGTLFLGTGCFLLALPAPLAAQQPGQAPPPPVVQADPAKPVTSPMTETDQTSQAPEPKQKICSPVLIRAGPNQGQLITKCHRNDRAKGETPKGG